jgi:hypothetical protein
MENFETTNLNELKVSDVIRENITSGMKWANFLTIVMCICVGFMLLGGASVLLGGTVLPGPSQGVIFVSGVLYILFALLFIYPIKLSFEGIRNVRDAFDKESQDDLESAALNLRKLLKYVGILTIIEIVIMILVMPLLLLMGTLMRGAGI